MMETVIYIFTNLFRVYLIYRFMQAFFERVRLHERKELFEYMIFFLVNSFLYLEFHLSWVNFICNLLGLVFICRLYTRNIKMNFFVTTMVLIVLISCDICATLFLSHYDYQEGEMISNPFTYILIDFLILICELVAEKIVYIKLKNNEMQGFPLILVPLCSLGIVLLMVYYQRQLGVDLVIVSGGLLIINFLVLCLYNMLLDVLTKECETKLLRRQVQMYANQLEIIMQTERKVKSLQHDMKHHMNEIKLMAMQHADHNIEQYIDCMARSVQNTSEIVASGNMEIDSLLNYILHKAQKELKDVQISVRLPENMMIQFDVNVILANLLENAVEAARDTDEKILHVNISAGKGLLRIIVENSYNNRLMKSGEVFRTTKNDKKNHGIGLQNVKRMVGKYHGTMEILTDPLFCVRIMMYI